MGRALPTSLVGSLEVQLRNCSGMIGLIFRFGRRLRKLRLERPSLGLGFTVWRGLHKSHIRPPTVQKSISTAESLKRPNSCISTLKPRMPTSLGHIPKSGEGCMAGLATLIRLLAALPNHTVCFIFYRVWSLSTVGITRSRTRGMCCLSLRSMRCYWGQ